MAIAPFANAQITIPIEFANVEGSSGGEGTALGNFDNTVQTVYNASLLAAAGLNPGDVLNGLQFRLNGPDNVPIWSVSDYQIRLATSNFSAGDLRNEFADNRGGDYTVVRSGALTLDGSEFDGSSTAGSTGPGTPNAFGPLWTFDTNFVYNGGDLLLLYTHEAPTSLNGAPVVTSRADTITNTFFQTGGVEFSESGVQTIFGSGFLAEDRGFGATGSGGGVATIVQFSVVPEPSSAALLMGIGMIGAVRRRKK